MASPVLSLRGRRRLRRRGVAAVSHITPRRLQQSMRASVAIGRFRDSSSLVRYRAGSSPVATAGGCSLTRDAGIRCEPRRRRGDPEPSPRIRTIWNPRRTLQLSSAPTHLWVVIDRPPSRSCVRADRDGVASLATADGGSAPASPWPPARRRPRCFLAKFRVHRHDAADLVAKPDARCGRQRESAVDAETPSPSLVGWTKSSLSDNREPKFDDEIVECQHLTARWASDCTTLWDQQGQNLALYGGYGPVTGCRIPR